MIAPITFERTFPTSVPDLTDAILDDWENPTPNICFYYLYLFIC